MKKNVLTLMILLVAGFYAALPVECKRSFGLGRSRGKKVSMQNVRRRTGSETVPGAPQSAHEMNAMGRPQGPPPAYPGLGNNPVSPNGAPPPYASHGALPPSYSASVNTHNYQQPFSYGTMGRIPSRGVPNEASLKSSRFYGLGHDHSAYGSPSNTNSHYPFSSIGSNLYRGNGHGGLSGVGTYGSQYGYGSGSSFGLGNVLTGLALWHVASGFNSHNRHAKEVHVYHENQSGDHSALNHTSTST